MNKLRLHNTGRLAVCVTLLTLAGMSCREPAAVEVLGQLVIQLSGEVGGDAVHVDAGVVLVIGPDAEQTQQRRVITPGDTASFGGLAPGRYRVVFEALEGGQVAYYGETSTSVVTGGTAVASIQLSSFQPTISDLPDSTTAFAYAIGFDVVQHAQRYHMQWSTGNTFASFDEEIAMSGTAVAFFPDTGHYYVRVLAVDPFDSTSVASGTGAVHVVPDTVGDVLGDAYSLGSGSAANGTIGDVNIYPDTDEDWFRFDACRMDTVTVETRAARLSPASALNTQVALRAEDGTPLVANDDDTQTDSRVEHVLPQNGAYLIRVSGVGGTIGRYELDVDVAAGPDNTGSACTVRAETMAVAAGAGQLAGVGMPVSVPPAVVVTDMFGAGAPDVAVTFWATGDGVVTGSPATTDATGRATVGSWTLGSVAGTATDTLWAVVADVDSVRFVATATGMPTSLVMIAGTDQTAGVGATLAEPFVVAVHDQFGNGVSMQDVTFSVTAGGGEISGVQSVIETTDVQGEAGVFLTLGPVVGDTNTVEAAVSGLTGSPIEFRAVGLEPVASVTITPTAPTIFVDSTVQLQADVLDGGGNPLVGRGVTWSSDDPAIASVDGAGLVTGQAAGSAVVTATSEGVSDAVTVTVQEPVAVVVVSPASVVVDSGGAVQLAVVLEDRFGSVVARPVTWMTTDAGVATVDGAGLVTGVGPGEAMIVVTAETVSDTAAVRVLGGPAEIVLTLDTALVDVADTIQVSGAVFDAAGHELMQQVVTWNTADAGIATVDADGVVTGVAEGTVTISATAGSASADATFFVLRSSFANSISVGMWHVCGVTTDGSGYCWGANPNGELATGDALARNQPTAIASMTFSTITAGPAHTCGITTDSTTYCWGWNEQGQLGNGSNTHSLNPVTVSGGHTFTSLSLGNQHTCALDVGGEAYCWGGNLQAQLGVGDTGDRNIPTKVLGGLRFRSIATATGWDHTCAIAKDGVAYCWGTNEEGRLGDPTVSIATQPNPVTTSQRFRSIAAGDDHTCAIALGGAMYCWGYGIEGELGDGTVMNRNVPTAVLGGLMFRSVAAGFHQTCGITETNQGYCWGVNYSGGVGNGTTEDPPIPSPVAGGLNFAQISTGGFWGPWQVSCGITLSGAGYCWGINSSGQLGNGDTNGVMPVPISGGLQFDSVTTSATDGGHVCGLVGTNAYCWGRGADGELGDGAVLERHVPTLVSGNIDFSQVALGDGHTCGLDTSGSVHCWGRNENGQLGNGTTGMSTVPTAVTSGTYQGLTAGEHHTCGMDLTGAAFCWGANSSGQLGDSSAAGRLVPVAVRGGIAFQALTAGQGHTCGLDISGIAFCWGNNVYGQLGDGTNMSRTTPVQVTGGYTFSTLEAGRYYTCGITSTGAGHCWGRNDTGQFGNGTLNDSSQPTPIFGSHSFAALAAGWEHACGLTVAGESYCWGYDFFAQLGRGTAGDPITFPVPVLNAPTFTTIHGKNETVCGLVAGGAVYCWGDNRYGQLGIGVASLFTTPQPVTGGIVFRVP